MVKNSTALRRQAGFTLLETLVALAIITLISLVVMGALAPWLDLKQKMDTERRMQDVRQGLLALYDARAMEIEENSGASLLTFTTSPREGTGCAPQEAAFSAHAEYFSESPQQLTRDGYSSPWCITVTAPQKEVYNGVDLWYRMVVLVSTGTDGVLDPGTSVSATGVLTLGGDDLGTVISGREVQRAKLNETLRRLNKVSHMLETYFTTRFMANASRDIAVYYFSKQYDTAGVVSSTGGNWAPIDTALASVGVGAVDSVTPWERLNSIELGNTSEAQNSSTVRSPATTGTGQLPYTALLRARIASPNSTPSYAVQIAVGNY